MEAGRSAVVIFWDETCGRHLSLAEPRSRSEATWGQRLFLFGSTARDEAVDDSDVDLFFDHERGQLGLYEVMDVADRATRILGSKADVMTRTAYIPARETISRNLP